MNRIGQIYCDMDGVLVNFKDPVEKMIKDAISGNLYSRDVRVNKLKIKLREKFPNADDFSFEEHNLDKAAKRFMMNFISHNPEKFFANLPPLLDGSVKLWNYINSLGLYVNILTAPVRDYTSSIEPARRGKTSWVQNHLSPQPRKIIVVDAVDKRKWAISEDGAPNVLIDDKKSTIDSWNEDGGIGILHVPGESENSIKILSTYF